MRKYGVFIAFLLITLLVVGCSSNDDASTEEEETSDDATTEEVEEKSATGPLVDPYNALNEREEMIKMVEEQKELYKPGFVNEDTTVSSISIHRNTDVKYGENEYDQLFYYASYETKNELNISYGLNSFLCSEGLEEWANDLIEKEPFNHGELEGYYGNIEHDYTSIVFEANDLCYEVDVSRNPGTDGEYGDKEKRLLQLLIETSKTEEDGAYDPIYSRFTIDLNEIKFPSLNKDLFDIRNTAFSYAEMNGVVDYSEVIVQYEIDESILVYEIVDEEEDKYRPDKSQEELQTPNGMNVIKFEDDYEDVYYRWKDDHYTYFIWTIEREKEFTDEEILEIIDSVMKDTRKFESLNFFQGVNEKAELDEKALEIVDKY